MTQQGGRQPFGDDDIDIWLSFYSEISDQSLLARLSEVLSDDERCRESRFYFAEDRKRYRVTRAMVRIVLSQYTDVSPARLRFKSNEYGRPEIANPEHERKGIFFNLSHTRGLIALAVARHAIGIDVENTSTDQLCIDDAARLFARTETDDLANIPKDHRLDRFYEYWTFKEAYIKARGMGLSVPLDRFSFQFPKDGAVQFATQPELGDEANRWSFWQFRPASQYLLALCAERLGGSAPKLTLFKTTPTVSAEVVPGAAVRTSHAGLP